MMKKTKIIVKFGSLGNKIASKCYHLYNAIYPSIPSFVRDNLLVPVFLRRVLNVVEDSTCVQLLHQAVFNMVILSKRTIYAISKKH